MKTKIITVISMMLFLSIFSSILFAADSKEEDAILNSTETLFKKMQERDYQGVWSYLSNKSKENIIEDAQGAMSSDNRDISADELRKDFEKGGPNAKAYWDAFLAYFDPVLVLEQSKWSMGKIDGDQAEVMIQYRKSDKPAVILMFKEQNQWKVGLDETFRPSRQRYK